MEDALGRPLTEEEEARLPQTIRAAQGRVIAAIGWKPFPPTTQAFHLRGGWSHRLQLPRRPVVAIESLAVNGRDRAAMASEVPLGRDWRWMRDPDGDPFLTQYDWIEGRWWFAPPDELIGTFPGYWGGANGVVDITYTYGYLELPLDLAALTADMAAQGMFMPAEQGMVRSEGLGPYRVAYGETWTASAAYGGPQAIIARYSPMRNWSVPVFA